MNKRHLEISNGNFRSVSICRAMLLRAAREWFHENGFIEVTVPHITGATGSCEWFPNTIPVTMYDSNDKEVKMFLRQTGQLYLESFLGIFEKVYTIGTSFRQEHKVTNRHLCEFSLIEFEIKNIDLCELQNYIENFIKHLYKTALEFFFLDDYELHQYIKKDFIVITYEKAISRIKAMNFQINYGDDLSSEHEKILCSDNDDLPTFVNYYPADPKPKKGGVIKFFSMKRNDDKTICCDLLLPGVGETVGGAVREGDPVKCKKQFEESLMYEHLKERGVNLKQFDWYFETLKNNAGHSAGCGIGFERLVQSILQCVNIKLTVELPRSPDYLEP